MTTVRVSSLAVGKTPSNIKSDLTIHSLRLLEDEENLPKGFSLFRILHQEYGDKRLIWDIKDFVQIREAQEIFKQLIAEGFVPYIIGKNGETTSMPMAEFDPLAGEVFMQEREIIMVPMQHAVGG